MYQLINFKSGNIIVPTFGECIANNKLFYVQEGLKRFEYNGSENFNEIYNNIRVLPIVSDPTSKDGDNDEILDVKDEEKLINNKFPKLFANYINDDKIKFSDIILLDDYCICSVPITKLGLIIKPEILGYYDEYGDFIEFDMENEDSKINIIDGYFDNWYLMSKYENGSYDFNCIYTQEIDKIKSKFNKNKLIKPVVKLFDTAKNSFKTIHSSYKINGFEETTKQLVCGEFSASVENLLDDMSMAEMFAKGFSNIFQMNGSGGNSLGGDLNEFGNGDFNIANQSTSYSDDLKSMFLKWQEKNFDTDNEVFRASKCLTYDLKMANDLGVTFKGIGMVIGGAFVFDMGGVGLTISGGSGAVVAVPAIGVGAAIGATGAVSAGVGYIAVGNDLESVNNSIKWLRDSQMFSGNKDILTNYQMNIYKNKILNNIDVKFKSKQQALDFINKKFPNLKQEIAGFRSAEGWHFDSHPIGGSTEAIDHINIYSKKGNFRVHITWGE